MKHIGLKTHVEAFIYDPLPTVDRYCADAMPDEKILAEAKQTYGNNLMAIAIYEVDVVEMNGITYHSEPLHRRRCAVDFDK